MYNIDDCRVTITFGVLVFQVWRPPASDGSAYVSIGVRPVVGRSRGLCVVGQRPGHPAMSHARRDHAMRVHGEEERRPGHTVRIHRPGAHIQNDDRAQGQTVTGHILPEAPAQQPAQVARVRVFGHGHPPPDHTQQHVGRGRRVVAKFNR